LVGKNEATNAQRISGWHVGAVHIRLFDVYLLRWFELQLPQLRATDLPGVALPSQASAVQPLDRAQGRLRQELRKISLRARRSGLVRRINLAEVGDELIARLGRHGGIFLRRVFRAAEADVDVGVRAAIAAASGIVFPIHISEAAASMHVRVAARERGLI